MTATSGPLVALVNGMETLALWKSRNLKVTSNLGFVSQKFCSKNFIKRGSETVFLFFFLIAQMQGDLHWISPFQTIIRACNGFLDGLTLGFGLCSNPRQVLEVFYHLGSIILQNYIDALHIDTGRMEFVSRSICN